MMYKTQGAIQRYNKISNNGTMTNKDIVNGTIKIF